MTEASAADLIMEHLRLKDYLAAESKRFAEAMAPCKARMEAIDNDLLARLNALGGGDKATLSTDAGTAYKSNLMSVSMSSEGAPYVSAEGSQETGRDALLSFALDHWDEIGSELLLFQPQKDAVRKYMDEHAGQLPPGLKVSYFTKVNVRRS